MKKNIKNIALSTITIVLLGSHAYAGKIITDAGDPLHPIVVEDKQYGFGGWNFYNINVKIVNTSDFNTAIPGSSFDTTTGVYTHMMEGMSFESEISTGGEVRGKLHGKDWPVGEPAGIKIINDDLNVGHGKPFNCIMTTSYQEYQITDDNTSGSGYLDAFATGDDPRPTLCSSPFQTHKRFKINLLPITTEVSPTIAAAGYYGKPVEITFNLDPLDTNTTNRRYQVLQKINNYTDMRLDGYKIEVLDENGTKNPALTLSLGEGEGLDEDGNPDPTVDIWGIEDVANMSHGLWGPYEKSGGVVRFDNGFFDYKTVYYDANLSDDNQTISYVGPMLGGNYQDLFGNWLPSIWAPTGIFHDDDHNPATDGILTAYLGVAPGYTERTWYKRTVEYDPNTPNIDPVYTWLPATAQDLQDWTGDWYEEDTVEDVLNLGVNYIVNVGTNSDIGSTFTIRITPHVDTNQTPPSSYQKGMDPIDAKYNLAATADFNNDGIADILWYNPIDGELILWYMNSDGTYVENNIGTSDTAYDIEGASDFNSDGIADILWKNPTDGQLIIWYMNSDGTYVIQTVYTSDINYNVDGIADFNNDGIADILWKNPSTGLLVVWYMNSDATFTWKIIARSDTTYNIDGVADFNNDGIADILWKNPSTDLLVIWYMNNNGTFNWKIIGNGLGDTYNIDGIADFNNNGVDDIIWRNPTSGDNTLWYMNANGTHT